MGVCFQFSSFGETNTSSLSHEILAKIISSDAISRSLTRTQTLGGVLANFLPSLFNDSLHTGFSLYSEELCHEFNHNTEGAEGTCRKELYRDFNCSSEPNYVQVRIASIKHLLF